MSVCTGSLQELPLIASGTQNSSVIAWLRKTRPAAGHIVICSCYLAWADPRIVLPSGSAGHKAQRGSIIPHVSWDLRHFLPRRWDYCYEISASYPRTCNVTLSLIIPYFHLDLCPEGSDVNGTRAFLQKFRRHIISPILVQMGHCGGSWQGRTQPISHYPNGLGPYCFSLELQVAKPEMQSGFCAINGGRCVASSSTLMHSGGNDYHLGRLDPQFGSGQSHQRKGLPVGI